MFKLFSLSVFCFVAVLAYVTYTIWTVAQLFISPTCSSPEKCFKSYLHNQPNLDLYLFSSVNQELNHHSHVQLVEYFKEFSYEKPWEKKLSVEIPNSVRNNGSFFLHFFTVPSSSSLSNTSSWFKVKQNKHCVYFRTRLTQLHVPDSYIFNLLKESSDSKRGNTLETAKDKNNMKPVMHLKSKITINMLTDLLYIPHANIPIEMANFIKLTQDKLFLPIMTYNFLETRLSDLILIKNSTEEVLLKYSPIYFGKLRFMVQLESTVLALKKMGFSPRDVDDIKSFFASTNFYLLCITIIISSFHLLFDFLAFKNDVSFWRSKTTMEGLSYRTVLWRAFSQIVVLLYLFDEKASLIVLGPSGIGTIIEIWKVVKVMKRRNSKESLDSEKQTNKYDAESMKYLSFILYPLCLLGALYSLFYQPHKSWYSWCIQSLVNGVYAFGFLFMLPQLFINYRLKSVEALPWRAFMYKAFNTFIDDVFAFIITMPTSHRVACFRDDIIFIVYLYQRWLYPVDKTRTTSESAEFVNTNEDKKEKKIK
ncbi:conserved hypothetical protein [Pediculus humanus corporis]|uniref:Lipid scramblase CLPTM1L n=1 Tax=Pediculus humanus subsp. corporis TaxID=121224 RepID=E0VAH6_PEDHC|nr:uncharacterized protein Phum_PHUM038260 [Pediculus humanus corporis]EEB10382.1 conserved hypothetical protein [Pediculus humanus corporis]